MKKLFYFLVLFFFSTSGYCQDNSKAEKLMDKAYEYAQKGNETKCIETLIEVTKKYPDYAPAYAGLGQIYCGKEDYITACLYYEKSISLSPNSDMNSYYRLGVMKKQMKDYSKAKEYFSYYIANEKRPKYKDRKQECEKELKNIEFIEYNFLHPVEFSPYSLGENVNDENYQYLPTLTIDEQLYITQRTQDKEDFFYCKKEESNTNIPAWSKKQKMPFPPNSEENVGAGSISPDGRYMFFAKCGAKDGLGSCDIYVCQRKGDNTWSKPKNLGPNVNSSSWDSQPSIASDGRTLFFVSNREGGFGKSDIYYSYLKKDGTWTKAKNLGDKVNTSGAELSPFIHPSNTTLYFASDGHIGMGGLDIYSVSILNGKFSEPKNLGYPINTEKDESCLVVSPDATYAVFATDRIEESNGKMNLYAFELDQTLRPTPVICMKGKVFYDDNKTLQEAKFKIKDLKTNKVVAETFSDKMLSTYLMTLPCGADYALSVECEGYLFYSENFSIPKDLESKYYEKDIHLLAIKEGSKVVLQNIFFATNSYELLDSSLPELETLLELLNNNPSIRIEISGHTDSQGKAEYNQTLSKNRAQSVRNYLIEKGINPDRITSQGYGQTQPIADNNTEEGRKQNRRTEFKIIK